jgi:cytochrome P450
VVRFGPNRISFNNVEAMKTIYAVQSNTQKSKIYSTYSHFFKVPSTVTTIDKKTHAFKRRISVRALSPTAIKGLEESIYQNCRYFLDHLLGDDVGRSEDWSKGYDMSKMISYLMSDIMGDVSFSRNWNMMRNEKNRHIIDVLSLGACLINTASQP